MYEQIFEANKNNFRLFVQIFFSYLLNFDLINKNQAAKLFHTAKYFKYLDLWSTKRLFEAFKFFQAIFPFFTKIYLDFYSLVGIIQIELFFIFFCIIQIVKKRKRRIKRRLFSFLKLAYTQINIIPSSWARFIYILNL